MAISRRIRITTMALATFAAAQCVARDIYTCNGPNGTKVFSETPCGKDAKVTEMRGIQSVGESPAVRDAAAAADAERQAAEDRARHAPADAPQAPAVSDSYECRVPNGETFYQHSPCPPSVQVRTVTWVGNRAVTGTQFAPVESIGISRSAACAAIRKPENRAGQNRDQSYSSYDRREQRDPCGK